MGHLHIRQKKAQEWCTENLPSFWKKEEWPGNSPDLNPIENLWAIMKQRLEEVKPATTLDSLQNTLKTVWSEISPETLQNLVASMPGRIASCIKMRGGYFGK